jgi:signal transduction histidine kinase
MEPARILVVEDEGITAMDTCEQLQSLGYIVPATAFSGEEAIGKVDELRPDLVLMDIHLQGKMDGIEAAAQIRTRFALAVIYVTAYADAVTLQRAKLTEPLGYVVRPFEERTLHATIEMALNKHRLEQQRREFLAVLSHDIRNPLGVVLGYTEMLEMELRTCNASHAEMLLQRLKNSAQHVHALVTNYLDVSRIEAGQLSLVKQAISLNELLQRLEQRYTSEAQRKSITLTFSLGEEPRLLFADPLALERVFTNLFSNALKFTPEGGLIIVESDWRGAEAVVEVRNTGGGIPPDELPFLFHKYRKVRKAQHRDGMGLGLFIVKTLVEAHGGRVTVDSFPDLETCFSVSFPNEVKK